MIIPFSLLLPVMCICMCVLVLINSILVDIVLAETYCIQAHSKSGQYLKMTKTTYISKIIRKKKSICLTFLIHVADLD